ncbi:MAG: IS200/IS605 family element transposase accessory protein TnpB [Pleurocapsa sp. SU_5_0]|nr:IS200/IS605 family element transposase accessory protein TnpB [Pleurocapsa sp. SU_5_0]NJR45242.1 IS200/IS605 family element transposase accessory protein TnpB [Hyellaceae cyanobacterium CSU_1_1]
MKLIHILIVEDELILAKNLARKLKRCGYQIVGIVDSGIKAIAKVAETQPDLILMDIVLKGDLNGIATSQKIQADRQIPIIYLSSYSDRNTLKQARETHPQGYILKPYNIEDVKATIESTLHHHNLFESNLKQISRKAKLATYKVKQIAHQNFYLPSLSDRDRQLKRESYQHRLPQLSSQDDPTVQPLPPTDKKVGIDVGISSLLTTSNGEKIANPKHFNRLYQKLKVAQKELSRKTKGSSNRHKARLAVAKIHAKIKDARTDFLHKLTTKLVQENSVIAIEDLAIRNMVRNHKLARSISDAAWGEMFRQLEYKCEWYGRKLVKIDRFFPSSKRCNHCGFVSSRFGKEDSFPKADGMDKLPLDIRTWDCPSCDTKDIDRDINAGKNILAAGLAVIVCGADVRPNNHSVKGQLRKTSNRRKKQKPKS